MAPRLSEALHSQARSAGSVMLQDLAWRPTIAFHQELEVQEEEEEDAQEVQEPRWVAPIDHLHIE